MPDTKKQQPQNEKMPNRPQGQEQSQRAPTQERPDSNKNSQRNEGRYTGSSEK